MKSLFSLWLFALVDVVSVFSQDYIIDYPDYAGNYLLVNKPKVVTYYSSPPAELAELGYTTCFWVDVKTSPGALMGISFSHDMTTDITTWTNTSSEVMRTNRIIRPIVAIMPGGIVTNLLNFAEPATTLSYTKSFGKSTGELIGVPVAPIIITLPTFFSFVLMPPDPATSLLVRERLNDIVVDLTQGDVRDLRHELEYGDPKYASTTIETQAWAGIVIASNCMEVRIHSDDGCSVDINGTEELSKFGYPTSWDDLNESVDYVCRLRDGINQVQVKYANVNTSGHNRDGISLILTCAAIPAPTNPAGQSDIWWFGSPYTNTYTYVLNRFSSDIRWTSSMEIVSTDDNLQTVTVKPNRGSSSLRGDWVTSEYRIACSMTYITSSVAVTIHYPTSLMPTGFLRVAMQGSMTNVINYQLLDQFGGHWVGPCFLTSTEQDAGGIPSSGTIGAFPVNREITAAGATCDTWSWGYPWAATTFDRIRTRRIHEKTNVFDGRTLLQRFQYHYDLLNGGTITGR